MIISGHKNPYIIWGDFFHGFGLWTFIIEKSAFEKTSYLFTLNIHYLWKGTCNIFLRFNFVSHYIEQEILCVLHIGIFTKCIRLRNFHKMHSMLKKKQKKQETNKQKLGIVREGARYLLLYRKWFGVGKGGGRLLCSCFNILC